MHISKFLAFGLPLVAASPAAPKPVDECRAVDIIVSVLKLNQATPFCSSFLAIQTSTATAYATVTSTSTQQVDGPTVTSTAYLPPITETDVVGQTASETTTVTAGAVSTISGVTTTTSTAWSTTTVYYSLGVNGRKRSPDAVNAVPIAPRAHTLPPFVAAFASSAISSACSCLSIPTPVTTTTLDVTATAIATSTAAPVTVAVSLGTTTTLSSTSLDTTSTETDYTTTTVLTTQYSTATAVVTSTTTVSRLAICSPGPNALYNQPMGYPSRPIEDSQDPTQLPDVQTCCEACYGRQNCVAATYLASQGTCFFGIASDDAGTSPAPPELGNRCPLGVGGNGVVAPGAGDWFPGPCVY